MSATPLQVLTRPFAVEPVTGMMLPDGIFDNALYNLRIAAHFTNTSAAPLTNVEVYLESVGDPGVVPVAKTIKFATVPAGATVLVQWDANFEHATPGKRLVGFVARADGFDSHRSIQQIFVSQTRFDSTTNTYTCTVEEGTLTLSKISAIHPGPGWGTEGHAGGQDCLCAPDFGPYVPTGMTLAWAPNPTYSGVHGDLPFADPWWKVLGLIVSVVAALVAIVAAAVGAGEANFSTKGEFDETVPSVTCCKPDLKSLSKTEFTVAGVASAVASAAVGVALADAADPFWRGQEATPPAAGEQTVGERVVAEWKLPQAPNAGHPYTADVKWTYTRFTTGRTYNHSVTETQTNIHLSDGVEVEVPATVAAHLGPYAIARSFNSLWVRGKFRRTGAELFRGPELYAFAVFRSPNGLSFLVPMTDDGLGFDPAANDGVYAGSLDLEEAYRVIFRETGDDVYGLWRVFLYAQDVNLTKPGMPPEIAAQTIGGFFVSSALTLTFDPSLPCPLTAHGTITVV